MCVAHTTPYGGVEYVPTLGGLRNANLAKGSDSSNT